MKSLVEQLKSVDCLVSDGAWGTFLQAKGLPVGACPELWCVDHRADVLDIPRSYIAAGADMVKTNSFGASRFKLDFFGLADRVGELNRAAAAISREAAGPDRHVIASVGPTGKMVLMGDVTEQELYDGFCEQLTALEAGGADACLIESMFALDEACQAIKAARENTRLEVICTFTFAPSAQGGFRSMMGVTPTEMAQAAIAAGAHVIGTNCGQGFALMVDIVRELHAAAGATPVLVHANAGLPHREGEKDIFPDTPATVAHEVPLLREAGARIIGGCCGTTPAHIAAIAKVLKTGR
jgi:5-methyltetrahydrofolate--homocysteine methyltransferase